MLFSSMAEGETQEAKFNMGIATLERIHTSLERIRWGFESMSGIPKQTYHINQVKILFMNVTPLLKKDMVEKYQEEIDGLILKSKVCRGRQVIFYDPKLESRLFKIVREWTIHLERYFMPKKSEFAGL